MRTPMKKGSFEYIKRRKMRQGFLSLLMFCIAFGILVLGLFLNDFSKANIFTVLAVLAALPASKMLISFIILLPFHSVSKKDHEEVLATVSNGVEVLTDVVFTSPEKIMMVDFMAIDHHYVICHTRRSEKLKSMEQYLRDGIARRQLNYKLEMYDDFERFKSRISKLHMEEVQKDKNYEETMEFLLSLMV